MTRDELSVGSGIVFWRLATANREYIGSALEAANMREVMPEMPTPLACLKSALSEEFPTKGKERITIRPVDGGYAVVVEPPKDTERSVGDKWGEVRAKVVLTDQDDEFSMQLDPYNPELRQRLLERIATKRKWLTPTAVGKILVSLVAKFDGVSYRDNGVVYSIPARNLNGWEAVSDLIESAPRMEGDKEQTMVHTLSVTANEKMLRAVCAGLTEEVKAELEAIEADIQQGSLKEEACVNRMVKAGQLRQKVKRYEEDMGVQLTELNAAIEKTDQAVAWATLQVASTPSVVEHAKARC